MSVYGPLGNGDVFGLIVIFVLGLVASILIGIQLKVRATIASLFYVWHTAFLVFFLLTVSHSDAQFYFEESFVVTSDHIIGIFAIASLVSFFSVGMGLPFESINFVFSILGVVGMLFLYSAFDHLTQSSTSTQRFLAKYWLLLPSVSYWSCAMGKEPIAFLAVGLFVWSLISISQRKTAFVLGTLMMFFVRPHVAIMMVAGLAVGLILAGTKRPLLAISMIMLFITTSYFFLDSFLSIFGLGNIDEVSAYLEDRQSANQEGGGAIDVTQLGLFSRLLTYLYRPTLIEASGMLGLAAAVENLLLVFFTIYGLATYWRGQAIATMQRGAMFFYFIATWGMLSYVTSNLGIAVRQKWMLVPVGLALVFSYSNVTRITRQNSVYTIPNRRR
jgi:hypothetical protein